MNQTSFQRKFLCLPLALALIAAGCGDGSSSDEPNQDVVVVPSEMINNPNPVTTVDTPNNVTTDDTSITITTTDNPDTVATTDNPDTVTTTDNPDTVTTTDNPNNAQQYEDAFVELSYPAGWVVDTSTDEVSARFLDSELNATGGQDNCGLFSEFIPGSSLIEYTGGVLILYDDTPEPQTSFPAVNGFDMSRIVGTITLFGLTFEVTTQIAYENESAHVVQCFDVDPEDIELIFNSMVIR